MARKEKIIAALALVLCPIIYFAVLLVGTSLYIELNNVPGQSYKNPETYKKYNIDIPTESKYVDHWMDIVSFNEAQGLAEFRIDEECDLTCFQTYEFTHKYDEGIEIFFDELFTYYGRGNKNIEETREIFQEYLDYIRIHDAYVQRGKVNSYSLYYPEDSKVIILFLQ